MTLEESIEPYSDLVVEEPFFDEVLFSPATEEPLRAGAFAAQLTEEDLEVLNCMECGANTLETHEYYMLHDHIWQSIVPEPYQWGGLCIGCVEWFLGRKLVSTDFTEAPVNYLGLKSERLQDRLGSYFLDTGSCDRPECSENAAEKLAKARNMYYDRIEQGW